MRCASSNPVSEPARRPERLAPVASARRPSVLRYARSSPDDGPAYMSRRLADTPTRLLRSAKQDQGAIHLGDLLFVHDGVHARTGREDDLGAQAREALRLDQPAQPLRRRLVARACHIHSQDRPAVLPLTQDGTCDRSTCVRCPVARRPVLPGPGTPGPARPWPRPPSSHPGSRRPTPAPRHRRRPPEGAGSSPPPWPWG